MISMYFARRDMTAIVHTFAFSVFIKYKIYTLISIFDYESKKNYMNIDTVSLI